MSLLYPDLGNVCSAPGCGAYDLLPSKCALCAAVCCKDHVAPDQHRCESLARADALCLRCGDTVRVSKSGEVLADLEAHRLSGSCRAAEAGSTPAAAAACSMPGCGAADAVSIMCDGCLRAYCIAHRHDDRHNCPQAAVALLPAQQLGARMTEAEAALPFSRWRYANKAATLDAQGVPQELRVGLRVFFPAATLARPRYLCVNRRWTVGKVLDAACAAAGVANRNNCSAAGDGRLALHLLWGACPRLPMAETIESLIESRPGFKMGAGVMVSGEEDGVPTGVVLAVPRWIVSLHLQTMAGGEGGLQEAVVRKSWLQRMDEGPSATATAVAFLKKVPPGQAFLALYVLVLLFVGWMDFV